MFPAASLKVKPSPSYMCWSLMGGVTSNLCKHQDPEDFCKQPSLWKPYNIAMRLQPDFLPTCSWQPSGNCPTHEHCLKGFLLRVRSHQLVLCGGWTLEKVPRWWCQTGHVPLAVMWIRDLLFFGIEIESSTFLLCLQGTGSNPQLVSQSFV